MALHTSSEARSACASACPVSSERVRLFQGNVWSTEPRDQGRLEQDSPLGVRIITATPEIVGVLDAVPELDQRGIVFSIRHRYVESPLPHNY